MTSFLFLPRDVNTDVFTIATRRDFVDVRLVRSQDHYSYKIAFPFQTYIMYYRYAYYET